jgi:hypothetical protein
MPTKEAVHNAVRSRFNTEITIGESVVTQFDNLPLSAVDQKKIDTGASWIRFTVRMGGNITVEFGSTKRYRAVGIGTASIFTALEIGDKTALILADKIETKFRTVSASGVCYRVPQTITHGREGQYWRVDVDCPFDTDTLV